MIEITSPQAFEYIRAQLNLGKTLCEYLKLVNIEKGRVFAFVEGNIDKETLYKFESGGLYTSEKAEVTVNENVVPIINNTRHLIPDYLQRYISENEDNCCIMEEPNARPGDSYVINKDLKYVHLNDEMYYFFDKENSKYDEIKKYTIMSEAYYLLWALSSLNVAEHDKLKPQNEISVSVIERLANNTTSFFIGAYDHEGFILWQK